MKSKNVFSMKLLGAVIISGLTVISCHNNDTTESTTATDTSSTTAMTADTSHNTMDTAVMPADHTAVNNTATNKSGTAKPNPAKKGMKGKVSVSETPAAKSNAKMEADNTGVYSNVEVLPSFPGGAKGMQKFFDDNLQYPDDASADGVEGTVNVSFVVDENGKLTSPKVEGDQLGYGLDQEALRVVNKMPTWNPGKLKGKNVKTKFTLPVRFVLY